MGVNKNQRNQAVKSSTLHFLCLLMALGVFLGILNWLPREIKFWRLTIINKYFLWIYYAQGKRVFLKLQAQVNIPLAAFLLSSVTTVGLCPWYFVLFNFPTPTKTDVSLELMSCLILVSPNDEAVSYARKRKMCHDFLAFETGDGSDTCDKHRATSHF
jgi:hypothetical protein